MLHHPTIALVLILACAIAPCHGQNLMLSKGKKTKTVKVGRYLELATDVTYYKDCDGCDYTVLGGQLVRHQGDSLTLSVSYATFTRRVDENLWTEEMIHYHSTSDALPERTVHTENIHWIARKGKKKLRDLTATQTVGAALVVLGTGAMAASPVARGDDTLNQLVIGVAGLGVGIFLGTAFKHPEYDLRDEWEIVR